MPLAPADAPETVARIHEGLPIVAMLARQLRRQLGSVELTDLESAGREGLVSAARSFDATLGVPFRRWANLRVRGAMIDSMRSQGNLPRRVYNRLRAIEAGDRVAEVTVEEDAQRPATTPTEADSRLDTYLATLATAMAVGLISEPGVGGDSSTIRDPAQSADEQLAQHELVMRVRAVVEQQPEAERHLLVRHYFDGITFEEAAKELGLSKSWASRLHARAIETVGRELKRQRVTG